MRTFISIEFPKEVIKELIKIQGFLPEFEGKKTETENLHLTLKFLGEIDESLLEKIKVSLFKINHPKLNLKLKEIGVFSGKVIKIIWIGVSGCENLQKEIDASLRDLFKKEERFMGHLTLARVKNIRDKTRFLNKLEKISLPNLNFEVTHFKLKNSLLTEKGPVYSDIETYWLRG